MWSEVPRAFRLAILLGVAGVGCGPGPNDWPFGRPRVVLFEFLEQQPQDALTLSFAAEFEDGDGDLGGGVLELEVQGRAAEQVSMSSVFSSQAPPLAPNATAGRFEFFVQLRSEVASGDEVEIGVVLEDASGERSNRPKIVLEAVEPGS